MGGTMNIHLFNWWKPQHKKNHSLQEIIIIINNSYKVIFSNQSFKPTALYKQLMTKTALTYISTHRTLNIVVCHKRIT